jgi:thiamine kinase-like enzyme
MEPAVASRALAATVSLASELGLTVHDAIVLQQSNRLAVRLTPCDVLARVTVFVRRNHEFAAFELKMAQELEEADGLVGLLDPRVEPIVHVRDGFAVTYWKYDEPLPASDITPDEYAQALEGLHAEMRQLGAAAPHFTERVDDAHAIVRDGSRSPELADDERELLTSVLRSVRGAIVDRRTPEQLLHGEPHAGNVLKTASGIRFIDLETCCHGPIEFDIAHTPIEVGRRYRSADRLQLRDCRILMLAMIAAWRSDRDDDYSNGRKQRGLLINETRKAVDHYGIDLYS